MTFHADRISSNRVLGECERLIQPTQPPRDLDSHANEIEVAGIERQTLLQMSSRARKVSLGGSLDQSRACVRWGVAGINRKCLVDCVTG